MSSLNACSLFKLISKNCCTGCSFGLICTHLLFTVRDFSWLRALVLWIFSPQRSTWVSLSLHSVAWLNGRRAICRDLSGCMCPPCCCLKRPPEVNYRWVASKGPNESQLLYSVASPKDENRHSFIHLFVYLLHQALISSHSRIRLLQQNNANEEKQRGSAWSYCICMI